MLISLPAPDYAPIETHFTGEGKPSSPQKFIKLGDLPQGFYILNTNAGGIAVQYDTMWELMSALQSDPIDDKEIVFTVGMNLIGPANMMIAT